MKAKTSARVVLVDKNAVIGEAIKKYLQREGNLPIEVVRSVTELKSGPDDIVYLNLTYPRNCGNTIDDIEKVKELDFKELVVFSNLCPARTPVSIGDDRIKVLCMGGLSFVGGHNNEGEDAAAPSCEACDEAEPRASDIRELLSEKVQSLSDREKQILMMIGKGLSSKEIAATLSLSKKTVDFHRSNILRKLDLSRLSQVMSILIYFVSDYFG